MIDLTKFDEGQKKSILARSNVVVEAGAGSGKTTVLAARYLSLVIDSHIMPENILVLTFTNKAQTEMYSRIYKTMAEHSEGKKYLDSFAKSRIMTLDSFAAEIARSNAQYFGFSKYFSIDLEQIKSLAETTALDFILMNLENKALKQLVSDYGFTKVHKDIFTALAVNHLSPIQDFPFLDSNNKLHLYLVKRKDELFSTMYSSMEEAFIGINADPQAQKEEVVQACQKTFTYFPSSIEDVDFEKKLNEFIASLNELNLRKGKKLESVIALKAAFDDIKKNKIPMFLSVLTLINIDFSPVYELFNDFQKMFVEKLRALNALDFSMIADMARESLILDSELRSYYKNNIHAIMIDEFQDNNLLQKEILFLLSEKNDVSNTNIPSPKDLKDSVLFFVGDAKQSIYRFRGADVRVFNQLAKDLSSSLHHENLANENLKGEGIQNESIQNERMQKAHSKIVLETNYRSEPGLIDFFNKLFPSVFGLIEYDYSPTFNKIKARGATEGLESTVTLLENEIIKDKRKNDELSVELESEPEEEALSESDSEAEASLQDEDDAKKEAYLLAKWIYDTKNNPDFKIVKSKTLCRPEYKDYAILLQTTTNQWKLEKALKDFAIPYTALNVCALFAEAPVNDIISLLSYCVYPEDSLSLAVILKGPFCKLDDYSFSLVMLSKNVSLKNIDSILNLHEIAKEKLSLLLELVERLRNLFDTISLCALIEYIWYNEGYRFQLLSNQNKHIFLEYFDFLFELARKADAEGKTTAAFVDSLRSNLGQYTKMDDLEPSLEETQGVQIMTIHKSKGLEFPIVAIPFTAKNPTDKGMAGKLFYFTEEIGPVLNIANSKAQVSNNKTIKNTVYEEAKEINDLFGIAEFKRLFYVACTRAESHIVFTRTKTIVLEDKPKKSKAKPKASFNGYLEDAFGQELEGIRVSKNDFQAGNASRNIEAISYQSYPSEIQEFVSQNTEAGVTALNAWYSEKPEVSASSKVIYKAKGEDALVLFDKLNLEFGTLCHKIIELKIMGAFNNEDCFIGLEESFNTEELRTSALALALKYTDRFFVTQEGLDIIAHTNSNQLANGSNVKTELAFTMPYEFKDYQTCFVSGSIDLLIEYDDYVLVIDFKTNLELTESDYLMQLSIYADAASRMFGKKVVTKLFMLRSGVFFEKEPIKDLSTEVLEYFKSS